LEGEPPIPQELLDAVDRVTGVPLRSVLERHLLELPGSMSELASLLREPSWVDAMIRVFGMDERGIRSLAATSVAVVAQELKNAPGEFERWMRGD
jgi:hypothetical protein